MKKLDTLYEYVLKRNISHKKDYLLKFETYFKLGGRAKFFLMPNGKEDIADLIIFLNKHEIEFKLIGLTTNVLFFDEVDYTVIISTKNINNLIVNHKTIQVDAGYLLFDFVRVCVINKFRGFEGLEGIPGTIGGAVFMNAGAYGFTISDEIISVECMNKYGEIFFHKKGECNFDYRTSAFKNNKLIILSVLFNAVKGCQEQIVKKIELFHIARHSYQEFSYPNLGSMISLNKDIYSEIFKKDIVYFSVYILMKLIMKNPLSKFVMRKRPNNRFFNFLLEFYIRKKVIKNSLTSEGDYFFSDKSANILINTGRSSGKEFYNQIYDLSKLSGGVDCVENEMVISPIYKVAPSFKEVIVQIEKELRR